MDEKMNVFASQLTERSETLREELIGLEKEFAIKKEEFLKIQGALEALQHLSIQQSSESDTTNT